MKKIFLLSSSLLCAWCMCTASADAASCLQLSADIGSGSSGSTVLAYQNFLKDSGYMSATPNGYFGPATLAGTVAFQSSRGISSTGFVGPLTRAAVAVVSCSTSVSTNQNTTPTASGSNGVSFTSNLSNATLHLGDTYTVSWSAPSAADLVLVIEDQDGVNKGSVSGYLGSSRSYVWNVGVVSVSGVGSSVNLPAGTYRLRLQGRMEGKLQSDAVTPYFTIDAPTLSIEHMYPSTLTADGKTPGVLYGSGFVAGVGAYLDDSWDKALTPLYISPDGKVMVFTVPSTVSTGRYRIVLRNNYGSSFEGSMVQVTH